MTYLSIAKHSAGFEPVLLCTPQMCANLHYPIYC